MSSVATPAASRLSAPSWKDARLLVGILLVLVATVLGSVVVASADDRVPMYAASTTLLPGQPLTEDQLVRVDVQLGDRGTAYLSATEALGDDRYVLRPVPAGELVPLSALGSQEEVNRQPISVAVDMTSASALTVGSVVDVYANAPAEGDGQEFQGPVRVLEHVTVSRLPESGSGLGGPSATAAVQVMAPTEKVKEIIGLVDAGAKITLVAVPGSPVRNDA